VQSHPLGAGLPDSIDDPPTVAWTGSAARCPGRARCCLPRYWPPAAQRRGGPRPACTRSWPGCQRFCRHPRKPATAAGHAALAGPGMHGSGGPAGRCRGGGGCLRADPSAAPVAAGHRGRGPLPPWRRARGTECAEGEWAWRAATCRQRSGDWPRPPPTGMAPCRTSPMPGNKAGAQPFGNPGCQPWPGRVHKPAPQPQPVRKPQPV